MKRYLVFFVVLIAGFCSCTDTLVPDEKNQGLVLDICVDQMQTRSVQELNGTPDELNENRIEYIDCFIYKNGSTDSTPATIYRHIEVNKDSQAKVNIHLDKSGYDLLDRNPAFKVYVIANLPNYSTIVSGTESITALKAISIPTSEFISRQNTPQKQANFVMTGEATTVRDGEDRKAKGTVNLKRLACKFGISVTASGSYTGEIADINGVNHNGTWTPVADGITVKFYGVAKDAMIHDENPTNISDPSQQYPESSTNIVDPERTATTVYYSYPIKPLPENRPYYIVRVPWTDQSMTIDTFYKVVCDYDSFDSNHFYRMDVAISRAGSAKEPEPVSLTSGELKFYVADWGDGKGQEANGQPNDYHTNAVIKDARYLVVKQYYVMENLNVIDIPFTSSHPCEVELISAKWNDYSAATMTERNISDTQYKGSKTINCAIPAGKDYLELSHTLDNDYLSSTNKNYDISPITFTVRLKHAEYPTKYKDIVIVQNPAITITAEKNSSYTGTGTGWNVDKNDTAKDNRFLNGAYGLNITGLLLYTYNFANNNSNASNLGGTYLPDNQVKNIYTITISALPEGSSYVLGDPRESNPRPWSDKDFFNDVTLASGADIDGNGDTNQLNNYYPTREDKTADNVIAPSFSAASAWSRCGSYDNNFKTVRSRCATYQEKGRPAGRWRLPTKAEAEILSKLNKDDKIPDLFSSSNNFLVAGGYAMKNGTVINQNWNQNGSVRPIYDEWYWSNTAYSRCTENTFTWGDMPRVVINH